MRYVKLFLLIITALAFGSLAAAYGQNSPPDDAVNDDRPEARRPNLFAELGLSPDQVRQIRRLNQARRPAMEEARQRLREANRNLDMAIYGNEVSDAEFQTRLKEFQLAEAEIARLRFESELSVRKVLTPEQLIKFRELRRRFAEMRNNNMRNRRMRRGGQGGPPIRDAIPQRRVN